MLQAGKGHLISLCMRFSCKNNKIHLIFKLVNQKYFFRNSQKSWCNIFNITVKNYIKLCLKHSSIVIEYYSIWKIILNFKLYYQYIYKQLIYKLKLNIKSEN